MACFTEWCRQAIGEGMDEIPHLEQLLEVAVCRIESAAAQRAADPISVLSNTASAGSRRASAEMLGHLGYTPAQIRITRRLLAGSTDRWPGLLRLFVDGRPVTVGQRRYVKRQLRELAAHQRHELAGGRSA